MEEILRHHMVVCAQAFCGIRDIKLSTLGQRVVSDRHFFLREGADGTFTVRKYDVVMAWFAANWPEKLPWPSDVPRPSLPVVDAQAVTGAAVIPTAAPAFVSEDQAHAHADSS